MRVLIRIGGRAKSPTNAFSRCFPRFEPNKARTAQRQFRRTSAEGDALDYPRRHADPHPDCDGIAGMKRTAPWFKEQGATVVESIEDPHEGHRALRRNPKNVGRVLGVFVGENR